MSVFQRATSKNLAEDSYRSIWYSTTKYNRNITGRSETAGQVLSQDRSTTTRTVSQITSQTTSIEDPFIRLRQQIATNLVPVSRAVIFGAIAILLDYSRTVKKLWKVVDDWNETWEVEDQQSQRRLLVQKMVYHIQNLWFDGRREDDEDSTSDHISLRAMAGAESFSSWLEELINGIPDNSPVHNSGSSYADNSGKELEVESEMKTAVAMRSVSFNDIEAYPNEFKPNEFSVEKVNILSIHHAGVQNRGEEREEIERRLYLLKPLCDWNDQFLLEGDHKLINLFAGMANIIRHVIRGWELYLTELYVKEYTELVNPNGNDTTKQKTVTDNTANGNGMDQQNTANGNGLTENGKQCNGTEKPIENFLRTNLLDRRIGSSGDLGKIFEGFQNVKPWSTLLQSRSVSTKILFDIALLDPRILLSLIDPCHAINQKTGLSNSRHASEDCQHVASKNCQDVASKDCQHVASKDCQHDYPSIANEGDEVVFKTNEIGEEFIELLLEVEAELETWMPSELIAVAGTLLKNFASARRNFDFVFRAVSVDGMSLQYLRSTHRPHSSNPDPMEDSLFENRDLALAAVSSTPMALQYVSENFKKDYGIVLEAISRDGEAIVHAAESLQNGKDILLAALGALNYVLVNDGGGSTAGGAGGGTKSYTQQAPPVARRLSASTLLPPLEKRQSTIRSEKVLRLPSSTPAFERLQALIPVTILEHFRGDAGFIARAVHFDAKIWDWAFPQTRCERKVLLALLKSTDPAVLSRTVDFICKTDCKTGLYNDDIFLETALCNSERPDLILDAFPKAIIAEITPSLRQIFCKILESNGPEFVVSKLMSGNCSHLRTDREFIISGVAVDMEILRLLIEELHLEVSGPNAVEDSAFTLKLCQSNGLCLEILSDYAIVEKNRRKLSVLPLDSSAADLVEEPKIPPKVHLNSKFAKTGVAMANLQNKRKVNNSMKLNLTEDLIGNRYNADGKQNASATAIRTAASVGRLPSSQSGTSSFGVRNGNKKLYTAKSMPANNAIMGKKEPPSKIATVIGSTLKASLQNSLNGIFENLNVAKPVDSSTKKKRTEVRITREHVLVAVANNGLALEFAQELQDDSEIAILAIENSPESLEFVSDRLQNDRRIVSAAISRDETMLFFASPDLQSDFSLVLEAAEKNPRAVWCADLSWLLNVGKGNDMNQIFELEDKAYRTVKAMKGSNFNKTLKVLDKPLRDKISAFGKLLEECPYGLRRYLDVLTSPTKKKKNIGLIITNTGGQNEKEKMETINAKADSQSVLIEDSQSISQSISDHGLPAVVTNVVDSLRETLDRQLPQEDSLISSSIAEETLPPFMKTYAPRSNMDYSGNSLRKHGMKCCLYKYIDPVLLLKKKMEDLFIDDPLADRFLEKSSEKSLETEKNFYDFLFYDDLYNYTGVHEPFVPLLEDGSDEFLPYDPYDPHDRAGTYRWRRPKLNKEKLFSFSEFWKRDEETEALEFGERNKFDDSNTANSRAANNDPTDKKSSISFGGPDVEEVNEGSNAPSEPSVMGDIGDVSFGMSSIVLNSIYSSRDDIEFRKYNSAIMISPEDIEHLMGAATGTGLVDIDVDQIKVDEGSGSNIGDTIHMCDGDKKQRQIRFRTAMVPSVSVTGNDSILSQRGTWMVDNHYLHLNPVVLTENCSHRQIVEQISAVALRFPEAILASLNWFPEIGAYSFRFMLTQDDERIKEDIIKEDTVKKDTDGTLGVSTLSLPKKNDSRAAALPRTISSRREREPIPSTEMERFILLDDQIVYNKDFKNNDAMVPMFCTSKKNVEIWPFFIEKAWSKLVGGYANLSSKDIGINKPRNIMGSLCWAQERFPPAYIIESYSCENRFSTTLSPEECTKSIILKFVESTNPDSKTSDDHGNLMSLSSLLFDQSSRGENMIESLEYERKFPCDIHPDQWSYYYMSQRQDWLITLRCDESENHITGLPFERLFIIEEMYEIPVPISELHDYCTQIAKKDGPTNIMLISVEDFNDSVFDDITDNLADSVEVLSNNKDSSNDRDSSKFTTTNGIVVDRRTMAFSKKSEGVRLMGMNFSGDPSNKMLKKNRGESTTRSGDTTIQPVKPTKKGNPHFLHIYNYSGKNVILKVNRKVNQKTDSNGSSKDSKQIILSKDEEYRSWFFSRKEIRDNQLDHTGSMKITVSWVRFQGDSLGGDSLGGDSLGGDSLGVPRVLSTTSATSGSEFGRSRSVCEIFNVECKTGDACYINETGPQVGSCPQGGYERASEKALSTASFNSYENRGDATASTTVLRLVKLRLATSSRDANGNLIPEIGAAPLEAKKKKATGEGKTSHEALLDEFFVTWKGTWGVTSDIWKKNSISGDTNSSSSKSKMVDAVRKAVGKISHDSMLIDWNDLCEYFSYPDCVGSIDWKMLRKPLIGE